MPEPILASAGSDWSYGGSILTFLFPMILFLVVAGVLWVLYTKPQQVPGRSYLAHDRSVIATPTVTAVAASAGPPGEMAAPAVIAPAASVGPAAASGQQDAAAGPAGAGPETAAADGTEAGE